MSELEQQERIYDVLVYGASGFTGKRVVRHLANTYGDQIRWAVGGRTRAKLEHVLRAFAPETDPATVGIVEVDALAPMATLRAALGQARVVINCVGPFRHFGEPIVHACVSAGVDYVDITGEPSFMDRMCLNYHEQAQRHGSIVIHACGFDSVPAELGWLLSLRRHKSQFPHGALHTVDGFLRYAPEVPMKVHATTYECLVEGIADMKGGARLRRQLHGAEFYPPAPTRVGRKPKKPSMLPSFDKRIGRWTMLFPFADASVVRNSQRFISQAERQRGLGDAPADVETLGPLPYFGAFMTFNNVVAAWGAWFWFLALFILAKFAPMRRFLIKNPRLCTFGVFSHEGPDQHTLDRAYLTYDFFGRGWKNTDDVADKPDADMHLRLTIPEPGYVATPMAVVEAAMTLLQDRPRDVAGGVFTPTAALANTSFADRLIQLPGWRVDYL
ncbi:MAG: hypothetical protein MHM6MM_004413 [Cercozoa sp. M6MM]